MNLKTNFAMIKVAPDTIYRVNKMKKIYVFIVLMLLVSACSMNSNWEYKIVSVEAESNDDFDPNTFAVTSEDLNMFGTDGWELVDVYTTIETVHPNFGNSEYVTGIRENIRTESVNYVFKRKK